LVPVLEEICALCDETYPYYQLRRCSRCSRLYCWNCTALKEDYEVICLSCFRRMVSPRGLKSKYALLSIYLARRAKYGNYVTLSFKRLEEIIEDRLPYSAYHYDHWWNNIRGRSQSEAWLTTGWVVLEVNLEDQEVTFRRKEHLEGNVENQPSKTRKRREPLSKSFRALAYRRPRRRVGPSKTKIAMVQATLRNIERKSTLPEYRGKPKLRKAYEKRLYKPRGKPA